MLVVLALTCQPPCSIAEELELCDEPWTSNWLLAGFFLLVRSTFYKKKKKNHHP